MAVPKPLPTNFNIQSSIGELCYRSWKGGGFFFLLYAQSLVIQSYRKLQAPVWVAEGKAGKQTSSETRSQMAEPRPGSQKQHRNEKVGSGDMQASGEGFEIDAEGADGGL